VGIVRKSTSLHAVWSLFRLAKPEDHDVN